MKNAKIVLVAEWDGWCGACGADRPLVLTRTGRQRLRTWLTGAADDSRPLLLTCRLCGTGVDVPLEVDDPPVLVETEEPTSVVAASDHPAPTTVLAGVDVPASAELTAGREAVAQALRALVRHRAPLAVATQPAAAAAPVVPLQREAPGGSLAELQLLADGIDLLSAGRT